MIDKIKQIIQDTGDKAEARAKLMFFLCFNLLEDDCRYTSGEIRAMIEDAIDALDLEE